MNSQNKVFIGVAVLAVVLSVVTFSIYHTPKPESEVVKMNSGDNVEWATILGAEVVEYSMQLPASKYKGARVLRTEAAEGFSVYPTVVVEFSGRVYVIKTSEGEWRRIQGVKSLGLTYNLQTSIAEIRELK